MLIYQSFQDTEICDSNPKRWLTYQTETLTNGDFFSLFIEIQIIFAFWRNKRHILFYFSVNKKLFIIFNNRVYEGSYRINESSVSEISV